MGRPIDRKEACELSAIKEMTNRSHIKRHYNYEKIIPQGPREVFQKRFFEEDILWYFWDVNSRSNYEKRKQK